MKDKNCKLTFSSINFSTKNNPTTKFTQTSFRIAFAEVSSEEQIQKAIEALNLRMIRGRRLSVKRAVRNKSKDFYSGKY